jgi:hypothetical protein
MVRELRLPMDPRSGEEEYVVWGIFSHCSRDQNRSLLASAKLWGICAIRKSKRAAGKFGLFLENGGRRRD